MMKSLQDMYRTWRDTIFVRFVYAVLTPFVFVLERLTRSHFRKVNGERTPGLTHYRQ
ncbi:hypothetical protein Plhal304r1_c016g0059241 [Plasmopara halstedii]